MGAASFLPISDHGTSALGPVDLDGRQPDELVAMVRPDDVIFVPAPDGEAVITSGVSRERVAGGPHCPMELSSVSPLATLPNRSQASAARFPDARSSSGCAPRRRLSAEVDSAVVRIGVGELQIFVGLTVIIDIVEIAVATDQPTEDSSSAAMLKSTPTGIAMTSTTMKMIVPTSMRVSLPDSVGERRVRPLRR